MTDRPFTTPEYPAGTPAYSTDDTPEHPPTYTSERYSTSSGDRPVTDGPQAAAATAKDEARSVAADAKESTRHVAETVKGEARNVAADTQQQARELIEQLRGEMTGQASVQTQRAAGGLRALAAELGEMAEGGQHHGLASDVARQAAGRARTAADWLEYREPGDILTEVRSFARRKPGTFLAAAAAVGFLGGRLMRGLTGDDPSSTESGGTGTTQRFSSVTPTYGGEPYAAEAAERYAATSPMASDPDRVGAGIDPATYSHADPTHPPVDRGPGYAAGDAGQELR